MTKPSEWTWATAPPVERGWWIRESYRNCSGINELCDLFGLTEDGARRIINGDIWRQEYERPSVNMIEAQR